MSPAESGQICMFSAMLGNNQEIFFPKLEEVQMETFDAIAKNLLKVKGYEANYCRSDEEAVQKAAGLRTGSRIYLVHFTVSDTSGEKTFEEFYIRDERVDREQFASLGVIIGKEMPKRKE